MGRHERIAELSQVGIPGLEVADLAVGRGRQVRALLQVAAEPIRVHAVDVASSLDDDVLHDHRVRSVLADLDEPLPFRDGALDRVLSLNVAEHLADPAEHLADIERVLKPGGLLVLAHSDWDTVLFSSDDDEATRALVDRWVSAVPSWAERSDGFMGRKLPELAAGTGLELLSLDTWADPHRRFDRDSVAWKVAMSVLTAVRDDAELTEQATGWIEQFTRRAAEGRFLFAVTDVALVLRRAG